MTVKELIEKLQACPHQNATVAIQIGDDIPRNASEVAWYQHSADCVFIADADPEKSKSAA